MQSFSENQTQTLNGDFDASWWEGGGGEHEWEDDVGAHREEGEKVVD